MLGALCEEALKYSCIPATSVPSERVFSKAGQIVSARWNGLLPDKRQNNFLYFVFSNVEIICIICFNLIDYSCNR